MLLPELTDEELVQRGQVAQDGDYRAFEELVGRYRGKVLANCRYLTRSPLDAEDLAQEVFVKVFFGMARFEGRSKFSTWLQRIKINHCLTHLRKGRGKHFQSLDEPDQVERVETHADRRAQREMTRIDERQRIERTLDALPESLRLPLILRDMDGLAYQEIADQLAIGLSAVKMRIKRGRCEFRSLFDGEPPLVDEVVATRGVQR